MSQAFVTGQKGGGLEFPSYTIPWRQQSPFEDIYEGSRDVAISPTYRKITKIYADAAIVYARVRYNNGWYGGEWFLGRVGDEQTLCVFGDDTAGHYLTLKLDRDEEGLGVFAKTDGSTLSSSEFPRTIIAIPV